MEDVNGNLTNDDLEKIRDEIIKQPDFDFNQYAYFRRITIPESCILVRYDQWIFKNWELLQAENPVITPEYFISLTHREMEEKKNVDSY